MHASIDHRISAIASAQHGIIQRRQLRACGLNESSIGHRIQTGRLHRIHRGVYSVGHRSLSKHARWMAAVLAAGPGAVLDRRDAAELHGIARASWRSQRRAVNVLCPKQRRSRRGIIVRSSEYLPPSHVTTVNGIPVVTVERLLVNLSPIERPTVLCKLIDEAAYHDRIDIDVLREIADAFHRTPGSEHVQDAIAEYVHGRNGTDSELEERALDLVAAAGIRPPACNVRMAFGGERVRVDGLWDTELVILEVDGVGHRRPTRRRRDERRRRNMRADGYAVFVLTEFMIVDPDARLAAIRRLRRLFEEATRRTPQRSADIFGRT